MPSPASNVASVIPRAASMPRSSDAARRSPTRGSCSSRGSFRSKKSATSSTRRYLSSDATTCRPTPALPRHTVAKCSAWRENCAVQPGFRHHSVRPPR
eukprot:90277-Chlamydomonas_euryale.AAC.1